MVNRINNKKITKKITKNSRKTRKIRKTRRIQKGGVATQEALDKLKNYKDTCCVNDMENKTSEFAEECVGKLEKNAPSLGPRLRKNLKNKTNKKVCWDFGNQDELAEKYFQKAAAVAPEPIEIIQQEPQTINEEKESSEKIISTNIINNNNMNNNNNNNKNKNAENKNAENKNAENNSNLSKDDLDDALTAYDNTLTELNEHLDKLTIKNNELEALITKLQNKEISMKEDLEKLKTIMDDNQSEILDLQEQITQKDSQYEKLTADLEQMTSDKEKIELAASDDDVKSQDIIKQLHNDIDELTEAETKLSSERDSLIARMEKIRARLTMNQTKFGEEISKLNKINNQIEDFKTKMSTVVSNIATPLTNAYSQFNKQAQQVRKERSTTNNNNNEIVTPNLFGNNNNNNGQNNNGQNNNGEKTPQEIALEKFNALPAPKIKSTNNDITKPKIVDNENTSNVVRNNDLNQRGGERQILYKMFGGGKKYNLRWRYVSHRTTFGGYNRKSLERLATKWGIQNAKSYKRRDLLQKTMHFMMFARYGDIKKRKNLNIAAKMIGINPRKYKKKQDLYRAVYSKTNKMSFNIRGGKKTKKTRKN